MDAGVSAGFDFQSWAAEQGARVERALSAWVAEDAPAGLGEAMRYAVLDGGKRLRPLLVLAASESVSEGVAQAGRTAIDQAALRAACAVELIHAYSLVHDDMPCMDNDVLRRGKPTVHVQYGEALALLAGDALQALAFELLTPDEALFSAAVQARLCRLLARAAGHEGMAGGQAIDLASVGQALTENQLRQMHRLKTGALLRGSVMMGAACREPRRYGSMRQPRQALSRLSVTPSGWRSRWSTTSWMSRPTRRSLGKTAGKDAAADKPTYVSVLGPGAFPGCMSQDAVRPRDGGTGRAAALNRSIDAGAARARRPWWCTGTSKGRGTRT
jgi:farnesyl diphosphate synthase